MTEITFASDIDTSNITNMMSMFASTPILSVGNLNKFNTSNVTTMERVFEGCTKLTNIDLSSFNTENVTNMYSMFARCSSLASLDLSNFDTSLVTDMGYMFDGCTSLTHLDIRNFTFDNLSSYYGNQAIFRGMMANCEIIVKSQTEKDLVLTQRSDFTNVKTITEYEAE